MTQINVKFRKTIGKKTVAQDLDIEIQADRDIITQYVKNVHKATSIISITDRRTGAEIQ